MTLSEWRGQWTFFRNKTHTIPVEEAEGGFEELCRSLTPAHGPTVSRDKASVHYFLPTHLKTAPLVGKTRERAKRQGLPLEGKQRSANHVTTANMIVVDLDGVPGEQFKNALRSLAKAGLSFLAYSSYSHGDPNKSGVRSRLVVPVDAPLGSAEYKRAASGLEALYFGGQADKSGTTLCQQQGVWAANPAWKGKAFRFVSRGSVASSEQLMVASPAREQQVRDKMDNPFAAACEPIVFDEERVCAALAWLDPEPYKTWVDVGLYLKAAYGDAGYECWLGWTNAAPESVTVGNTGSYAPEAVWESLDPFLPPDAGAGALFASAKDASDTIVRQAAQTGTWTERAYDAVGYLLAYHNRHFRENYEG